MCVKLTDFGVSKQLNGVGEDEQAVGEFLQVDMSITANTRSDQSLQLGLHIGWRPRSECNDL